MTQLDVLVAHPLKHHVYPLAAGIQRSGLNSSVLVPLYRKGFGAYLAMLPGGIGRKARGYHYAGLNSRSVISPMGWQARRLLASSGDLGSFEVAFDSYVAERIRAGVVRPRVLVTMQDYMPLTVQAGKQAGAIIWSDQILNQSVDARQRIERHLPGVGASESDLGNEAANDQILALADVVTVPSGYVHQGILGRTSEAARVYRVPYGVDAGRFTARTAREDGVLRVVARANSVRKGGHLLLGAIQQSGKRLRDLAGGRHVEFIIIGSLEEPIRVLMNQLEPVDGLTVRSMVVPHLDMPRLLASSDLFVMPSLSEGMSLICIEAMQAGLPMVITPFCGIDCFRPLEMGVLVQDDVESVSTGLVQVFTQADQWPSWGDASRREAVAMEWAAYESRIESVAKELL